MRLRLLLVLALMAVLALFGVTRPSRAEPIEIHYAPAENLERLDAVLIASARERIDLAAYVLTDRLVIDALVAARRRGVALRVLLDPRERHALDRRKEISRFIRMKAPGPYMHLKSYLIDRQLLRTGSANLSASGLKQQDNDLVALREPTAVRAFAERFERLWTLARPLPATPAEARGSAGCAIKGETHTEGVHRGGWFCSERGAAAGSRPAGGGL